MFRIRINEWNLYLSFWGVGRDSLFSGAQQLPSSTVRSPRLSVLPSKVGEVTRSNWCSPSLPWSFVLWARFSSLEDLVASTMLYYWLGALCSSSTGVPRLTPEPPSAAAMTESWSSSSAENSLSALDDHLPVFSLLHSTDFALGQAKVLQYTPVTSHPSVGTYSSLPPILGELTLVNSFPLYRCSPTRGRSVYHQGSEDLAEQESKSRLEGKRHTHQQRNRIRTFNCPSQHRPAQELFENIQAQVIAITTAEELVADSLTLEDQHNSINFPPRRCGDLLHEKVLLCYSSPWPIGSSRKVIPPVQRGRLPLYRLWRHQGAVDLH